MHGFNKEEEDIEHDDYHTEFVDEQESSVLLVTEVRVNEIIMLCFGCCDVYSGRRFDVLYVRL